MIVEFFITEDKKFAYRCKANNGRVLVTSHGYSTYRKCVEGWRGFEADMCLGPVPKFRWTKDFD